jgi:hypothetical protein
VSASPAHRQDQAEDLRQVSQAVAHLKGATQQNATLAGKRFSLIYRRYSHLDKGSCAAQDKPVSALVVLGRLTRVITAFNGPSLWDGLFFVAVLTTRPNQTRARTRHVPAQTLLHAIPIEQFKLPR